MSKLSNPSLPMPKMIGNTSHPNSNNPINPSIQTALSKMFFHYKQVVCHNVALPFKLKGILRQKKNYENSNISPCKTIMFKKIL
jgi:hypothetical protein